MDFFVIGPQRTATSWLHEVLSMHTQVYMPKGVKETMFFDRRYGKGIKWFQWHFREASSSQVLGEIAPTYFDSELATSRLHKHYPEAKLFVLVRNPIERAFSLYRHELSKGRINCGFDEALDRFPFLIQSGKYRLHCTRWEEYFPASQLIYVFQEDIRLSPQKVVDQLCLSLGIESIRVPVVSRDGTNSAKAPRSRLLAWSASMAASSLRSLRFYGLVNAAKKIGLKSVFSGGKAVPDISFNARDRLFEEFREDIIWLEARFGNELSKWIS